MAMLKPGKSLEGKQKTIGTIKRAEVKTIPRTKDRDAFDILELEFENIRGPVRDVLGNATLKVGLSAGNVTLQSRVGRLAKHLFGWNGKTDLNTDAFRGQEAEFYVEPQENENGVFWNINRNSIGPIGHLKDVPAEPEPEPVAAE